MLILDGWEQNEPLHSNEFAQHMIILILLLSHIFIVLLADSPLFLFHIHSAVCSVKYPAGSSCCHQRCHHRHCRCRCQACIHVYALTILLFTRLSSCCLADTINGGYFFSFFFFFGIPRNENIWCERCECAWVFILFQFDMILYLLYQDLNVIVVCHWKFCYQFYIYLYDEMIDE